MELKATLLLVFASCLASTYGQGSRRYAKAALNSGGKGVDGAFVFVFHNNTTYIEGVINNLRDGEHGLHIHESGNVRDNCKNIQDHYNPFNRSHSCDAATGHLGDLGNVMSTNGVAIVQKFVVGMTLAWSNGKEGNGNPGVVGLSIAVDTDRDTCDAATDGASGPPLACGRITGFDDCRRRGGDHD